MIFAFQMGLNIGVKKTLWAMLGLSVGLGILLCLALAGLGFLANYPSIFAAIKLLGALYLLYLAWLSWYAIGHLSSNTQTLMVSPWRLIWQGIWVSLSNPKAILFFAAFFPKFIHFDAPLWPQYAMLTIGFFAIETSWQLIYAMGGMKLAAWLNFGQRMQLLNRLCALIFLLIALLLIAEMMWAY